MEQALTNNKGGLEFYIASNNEEILRRVNQLIGQKGLLGLTDMQGKIHYMVDGRRGAPYAARRIEDVARMLLREGEASDQGKEALYVDAVLRCYLFHRGLKGFRYLRHMLMMLALDPSLLSPISKTLYPATASSFHVSASQVERNVRYTFDKLKEAEDLAKVGKLEAKGLYARSAYTPIRRLIPNRSSYPNGEGICVLHEAIQAMKRKDQGLVLN